jgi:hypothetical protein
MIGQRHRRTTPNTRSTGARLDTAAWDRDGPKKVTLSEETPELDWLERERALGSH